MMLIRQQQKMLYLMLIATCYVCYVNAEECDVNVGPAGVIHCVKIARYSDNQWATCRTDQYIKTKSKLRHQCSEQRRIYCNYQCMLDDYNQNNGNILPHCRCSPGVPQPTEKALLSAWCFSPDGKACNWYNVSVKLIQNVTTLRTTTPSRMQKSFVNYTIRSTRIFPSKGNNG